MPAAGEGLLLEAALLVLLAPLAGVGLVSDRSSDVVASRWSVARLTVELVVVASVTTLVSGLALWVSGSGGVSGSFLSAHLLIWSVSLALLALGAICAALFTHALDAAGVALLLSSGAGFGVLALGPLVAAAPAALVRAWMVASPVLTAASAADIDILRGEFFYRISPLAHSGAAYPGWSAAVSAYLVMTAVCVVFTSLMSGRNRTVVERTAS